MERADQPGSDTEVSGRTQLWIGRVRIALGLGVLGALIAFGAMLVPPYLRNLEFQQYLEKVAYEPDRAAGSLEVVRIAVVDKAARLGLPIRPDQVRVTAAEDHVGIEVRYFVRVDLPFYTVDLHFRPRAGGA